jgi:hypothetical protein
MGIYVELPETQWNMAKIGIVVIPTRSGRTRGVCRQELLDYLRYSGWPLENGAWLVPEGKQEAEALTDLRSAIPTARGYEPERDWSRDRFPRFRTAPAIGTRAWTIECPNSRRINHPAPLPAR